MVMILWRPVTSYWHVTVGETFEPARVRADNERTCRYGPLAYEEEIRYC